MTLRSNTRFPPSDCFSASNQNGESHLWGLQVERGFKDRKYFGTCWARHGEGEWHREKFDVRFLCTICGAVRSQEDVRIGECRLCGSHLRVQGVIRLPNGASIYAPGGIVHD